MPIQTKYKSQHSGEHIDEDISKVDSMADYIVEQKVEVTETGLWTIRKWNSGIAECWGRHDTPELTFTQSGEVYVSQEIDLSFPVGLFYEVPNCLVNIHAAGGLISAKATNGTTTSYLRYQIVRSADYSSPTKIMCHAYGAWKVVGEKKELKVMSYNVDLFGAEAVLSINSQQALQSAIISANTPDIIGFQEFTWGSTVPEIASQMLSAYTYVRPAYDSEGNWGALGVASKDILLGNLSFGMYSAGYQDNRHSARCYTKAYLRINGRRVAWFNTHLAFENDEIGKACRYGEAEELYGLAMQESHFIITGDLNCQALSESDEEDIRIIKPFVSAGCGVANGTIDAGFNKTWGASTTATSTSDLTKCFDTIIVSPNISIKEVTFDTNKFNSEYQNGGQIDHIPIMATLEI